MMKKLRLRRVAIGLVGMLVLVSGCSDGEAPSVPALVPLPAPNTLPSLDVSPPVAPTSSAQALPYAGALKVANPLPESVLAEHPCQGALTPQQVKLALGIEAQGRSSTVSSIGPFCSWANPDTSGQITVAYDIKTRAGLSGEYKNVKPRDPSWKELPLIQGFPAVANAKHDSSCQISVGLADDVSIAATLFLGQSNQQKNVDPCELAPQAADLVVITLKKKAGA